MTPDALRYRLNDLGLTQGGLARLLEVNPRTVRRWMSGAQETPDGLDARMAEVSEEEVCAAMAPAHGSREESRMRMDQYVARRRRAGEV